MPSRQFGAALFGIALASLAVGLACRFAGEPGRADLALAAGTSAVLIALCVEITRSLAQGRFGLDIIAAFSMAGCLAAGEMLAGCVVALMFSGGQLLEGFAQGRAEREMTALLSRVPRTARVLRGGQIAEVHLEQVAPGDRVLVRPGEVVPVDGRLVDAEAVLDESAMTGESLPVRHAIGEDLMSGSTNAGGAFAIDATRDASQSTYARIVKLVESAQQSRAPMARLADRWSVGFLILTVVLSGGTWLVTGDVLRSLAVLVAATPCPLILAVPVAIVAGLSRAARHGVLVKSAGALERLAGARTLLLDKTGTLTGGVPTLTGVALAPGFQKAGVLRLAASLAQGSSHVVSAALVAHARREGLALATPESVRENHGAGVSGVVDGHAVALGGATFVGEIVGRGAHGSRIAAKGGSGESDEAAPGRLTTHVAVDGREAAVLTLVDPVRPEALATLQKLRDGGMSRIVLVTGDRDEVAMAVAADLPIDRVVAQVTPEGKVAVVHEERAHGSTVMVGDGVNDAPALAAADVGIAMGARGAAASSEAADAVILVDAIDRLPAAFSAARRARAVAVESVAVGMGLSLAAMVAASLGYLTPLQGAIIQEAIDVTVVLNALRALTGGVAAARKGPARLGRAIPGH